MADRPTPPRGLQAAGKSLWQAMWSELPDALEFDGREQTLLLAACRQADAVAALERAIQRDGAMVPGSRGQQRLHPAIVEARQGRLALDRLLGGLQIPDGDERPMSSAQHRAAQAARARWESARALREARDGA